MTKQTYGTECETCSGSGLAPINTSITALNSPSSRLTPECPDCNGRGRVLHKNPDKYGYDFTYCKVCGDAFYQADDARDQPEAIAEAALHKADCNLELIKQLKGIK